MRNSGFKLAALAMLAMTVPGAAAAAAAAAPTGAAPAPSAHALRGMRAGAQDFASLANYLCAPARPRAAPGSQPQTPPRRIAPGKAFDNLYFLGHEKASAWVIRTSAGLILVDALDNADEAQDYIENGMRSFGLDPAQIKLMIVTHYHYDHTGGAAYLAHKYHPQVIMGAADWQSLAAMQKDLTSAERLERDRAIERHETVTLGDTEVDIYPTPGHTAGTLSLIFPVREGQRMHQAVLWGGTDIRLEQERAPYAYAQSASLMRQQVERRGIDVFLSNHASADGAEGKLARLSDGSAKGNPFVLSVDRTRRAFEMFHECALARADYLNMR